mgnify:CR=1 FL=1
MHMPFPPLPQVAQYIQSRVHEDGLQCLVISLKEAFYSKADALVGICKDAVRRAFSLVLFCSHCGCLL